MKRKLAIFSLVSSLFLFNGLSIQATQAHPLDTQLNTQSDTQKDVNRTSNEKPKVLSRPFPHYPEKARLEGIEGDLEAKFDVDENGRVENIRILNSTLVDVFGLSLVQAMEKWRYETGKPTKDLKIVMQFRLN